MKNDPYIYYKQGFKTSISINNIKYNVDELPHDLLVEKINFYNNKIINSSYKTDIKRYKSIINILQEVKINRRKEKILKIKLNFS